MSVNPVDIRVRLPFLIRAGRVLAAFDLKVPVPQRRRGKGRRRDITAGNRRRHIRTGQRWHRSYRIIPVSSSIREADRRDLLRRDAGVVSDAGGPIFQVGRDIARSRKDDAHLPFKMEHGVFVAQRWVLIRIIERKLEIRNRRKTLERQRPNIDFDRSPYKPERQFVMNSRPRRGRDKTYRIHRVIGWICTLMIRISYFIVDINIIFKVQFYAIIKFLNHLSLDRKSVV